MSVERKVTKSWGFQPMLFVPLIAPSLGHLTPRLLLPHLYYICQQADYFRQQSLR